MSELVECVKRPYTVVVVENSKSDARMIVGALRLDGRPLNLTVLPDGERASRHLLEEDEELAACLFGRPDLILLDLNLPRKSGLELVVELKAEERFRDVPMVVFTSSELTSDALRCYESGANCVVHKPMELDPFVAAVRSIARYWLDVVGPTAQGRGRLVPLL